MEIRVTDIKKNLHSVYSKNGISLSNKLFAGFCSRCYMCWL